MIKTQIINEDDKPIAVIMDYKEYLRLKEYEEDVSDYLSATEVKKKNTVWIKHKNLQGDVL